MPVSALTGEETPKQQALGLWPSHAGTSKKCIQQVIWLFPNPVWAYRICAFGIQFKIKVKDKDMYKELMLTGTLLNEILHTCRLPVPWYSGQSLTAS